MHIPSEFIKLSKRFHQDTGLIDPSAEKAIQRAIGDLTIAERRAVKVFLDELLEDSRERMTKTWSRSGAEIDFTNSDQLAAFLRLIVKEIELTQRC